MPIRSIVFAFSLILTGCKTPAQGDDAEWQQFLSRYAHVYCDLRSVCDVNFDSEFGEQEQCRKEVLVNENKGRERRQDNGCSFQSDMADGCVDAATVMSCDEWKEGGLDGVCGGSLWSCE